MKYIRTYENFKINEEVPFNYDTNFNNIIDDAGEEWTEKEKETLEKLGADKIGKSTAIFLEQDGDEIEEINLYKKTSTSYKIESSFYLITKNDERYDENKNFTDFTDMIQYLIKFFKAFKEFMIEKEERNKKN